MGEDKHWAQSYLIDPLIAPDPSDETGPGSHFRSTFAPASLFTPTPPASAVPHDDDDKASSIVSSSVGISNQPTGSTVSTNPFRRSGAGYPTPPNSVSPRKDRFPSSSHRAEAFGGYNEGRPLSSGAQPSSETLTGRPRRTSSLKARFAGDESHRPLDIIRRDSKRAHNSPHLKKKHMPAADLIDRLDVHAYHHEGPYDAVLAVRNTSLDISPLAAVADSNREALKATPKENVLDSLQRHRPLEGTAMVPPGVPDGLGRVYDYEEGTDMMRDLGGNYKRWDHVPYHPDDLKGKGEPSYTIEKALKEHDATNGQGIELKSRSRNKSMGHADRQTAGMPEDNYLSPGNGGGVMRRNTTGKRVAEGLKRTFGSLRRKKASS